MFGNWLETSPSTPSVCSSLCISMKLNSVSDSASPLCQRWLCHPQGPHLSPCWHSLPASDGTRSPGPTESLAPKQLHFWVTSGPLGCSLKGKNCSSALKNHPQHMRRVRRGLLQPRASTPAPEVALSQQHTELPAERASTQSYQHGEQPQNVGVLRFCAPATERYLKWKNCIEKNVVVLQ